MLYELDKHQVHDLSLYLRHKKFANFSDPGTRKTGTVNILMYHLWDAYQMRSVMVMPLSLFKQNMKSFFKFTHFKPEDIVIVEGDLKRRQKLMQQDGKVFIVGFDFFKPYISKVRGMARESDYEFLKRAHPSVKCCVVDEFHMGFGNIEATRTRWWAHHMQKMEYIIPMTGTPINGRLSSVYPVIHVIEPSYYFNYKAFLREHAVLDDYGNVSFWVNTQKVKDILAKISVRHTFEEVHGPEAIEVITEMVDMSGIHRDMYKAFEESHMLELENEFKEMSSGGEATLRARQLLQCPEVFYEDDFKLGKDDSIEVKVQAAVMAEKPFMIFSPFVAEQNRLVKLCHKWGVKVALINGSVKGTTRYKIDEDFTSGKIQGLIASPDTVGVGYDWSHVDMMVFTTLDYKDSSFVQGYRRAVRGKRAHPLLVYVLGYSKSTDLKTFLKVEEKMKLSKEVDDSKTVFNFSKSAKKQEKAKSVSRKPTLPTNPQDPVVRVPTKPIIMENSPIVRRGIPMTTLK
jgi:hypothetical protein